ncbi:cytochrome P460 family protein [Enterovibrio coralii]|uniref:Cytochrome C n=1 Tax=Enterovibrio coralii TaxID=294935 RepID=A0A135IDL0_9GAMM|nr:cytochrome P460 family protein [Enterovibrio coralii]KXF83550.1 cytochrome C [Enterovibrio coralii]
MNRIFKYAALSSLVVFSATAEEAAFSPYVTANGEISFPENFRDKMMHLGSWFVPAGGASGFHGVYTEPASVEAFRKNGQFPDGATIVKELRAHATGDFTTGTGVSYETAELKQWFVMIKDSENRFSDSKIWGDGWGWALFKPGELSTNASTNYQTDCLGCHVPAKETDWIYTQAYPVLFE